MAEGRRRITLERLSVKKLIQRIPYYGTTNPFYIGVASWTESALDRLIERGIGGRHHMDTAMQEEG